MKIAIDISQINRDGAGIGYVAKGLVRATQHFEQHLFFLIQREEGELEKAFTNEGGWELPPHVRLVTRKSIPKLLGGGFTWYSVLGLWLKKKRFDFLLSPTLNSASMFYPKVVQVLHDLSPITGSDYNPGERKTFIRMLNLAARKVWRFVSISKTSKKVFLEHYPKYSGNISVIPLGLNSWVEQESTARQREALVHKYQLTGNYVLSISTIQPRKNYERMIRAFAQVSKHNPDLQYVIGGGKGWKYDEIFDTVKELELEEKVIFLGYVPEEEMPALYDGSRALLFVSVDEGFGLPAIEAHARGIPVLTSDIPVLKELELDDKVVYVDPLDENSIAEGIESAIKISHFEAKPEFFQRYNWQHTWNVILETVNAAA